MATKIAEAFVETRARLRPLERDLSRAESKTRTATQRMEGSFKRVTAATRTLNSALGLIGVGLGAAGLQRLISQTVLYADTLDKTSQRLNVNVEELQRWRFAADQAGIGARTFDLGLQRFLRRLGEARQGTGELRETLVSLGVDFQNTRDGLSVLEEFFERLSQIEDPTRRLAAAFKAFDSEGVALLQLVDNFRRLRDAADDANQVISLETIGALVQLKDEISELSGAFRTLSADLVAELTPSLIAAAGVIAQVGENIRTVLDAIGVVDFGGSLEGLGVSELEAEAQRLEQELQAIAGRFGDVENEGTKALLGLIPISRLFITTNEDLERQLELVRLKLAQLREGVDTPGAPPVDVEGIERAEALLARISVQRLQVQGRERQAVVEAGRLRDAQLRKELEGNALRAQVLRANAELVLDQLRQIDQREEEVARRQEERDRERVQRSVESFTRTFADVLIQGEATADRLKEIFLRKFVDALVVEIASKLGGALFALAGPTLSGIPVLGTILGLPTPTGGASATATAGRISPGGGGSQAANVEVLVSSPIPMQVSQRGGSGASPTQVIVEAVGADILRGGAAAQAIERRFGVARQGVRR